jgi:hypothetical protein
MKNYETVLGLLVISCALMFSAEPALHSQDKTTQGTVQVHLVITNEAQRGDEVATLTPSNPDSENHENRKPATGCWPAYPSRNWQNRYTPVHRGQMIHRQRETKSDFPMSDEARLTRIFSMEETR